MAAWAAGPSAECRLCHRAQAEHFSLSGMALALVGAGASEVLHGHDRLTAKIGGYFYEIARSGDGVTYTVTDGKDTLQSTPRWAFGSGEAGQTLVFQRAMANGMKAGSAIFWPWIGSTSPWARRKSRRGTSGRPREGS